MDTIRKLITRQITDRLHYILVANGFNTDVGQHVHKGLTYLTADQLPGVTILPGVESAEPLYGDTARRMPVDFIAFKLYVPDTLATNVSEVAEDLYGDLLYATMGTLVIVGFNTGNREITEGMTVRGQTSTIQGRVVSVSVTGGSWAGGTAAGALAILLYSSGPYTVGENLLVGGLLSARVASFNLSNLYGGFVQDVVFRAGGISTYPSEGDKVVMVELSLDFIYHVTNNPYTQGG